MKTLIPPMQNINTFFEDYARALELYDTKGMSFLYNIPCMMLSDESTTLFNDAGRLEGFFNQGVSFYRQFGIAMVRPEVWNRRQMTDRITSVKVNWQYFDKNKEPIYNCDYYYVLKLDKNHMWKIIQSVSVNEKERMELWQVKLKNELVDRLKG
jgi:hypothetical protein